MNYVTTDKISVKYVTKAGHVFVTDRCISQQELPCPLKVNVKTAGELSVLRLAGSDDVQFKTIINNYF